MTVRKCIRILDPGPLATVQDRGRWGFRSWGVPLSGAMDPLALRFANLLAGNGEAAAGLEIAVGGFRAEFLCAAVFCLAGAVREALIDGSPVEFWRACSAKEGSILSVDFRGPGLRIYLAVSGGIDLPPVMGSRSTYLRGGFGGLSGRALRALDLLPLGNQEGRPVDRPVPEEIVPDYSPEPVLRAIPGPQDERLSRRGRTAFFTEQYEVSSRTDRMGMALSGAPLELTGGADIISDGTCPGAVQVHGNGQPTILGADCQTTGGYVKFATVISSDLPLVAQLAPGDRVRFEETDLWSAREIYMKNEYLIRRFFR